MPDPDTLPWVCIKRDPTNRVIEQIVRKTNCALYLMYLSSSTSGGSSQVVADANTTWNGIVHAHQDPLVPLCSATTNLSTGGDNWRICDSAHPFTNPGSGKNALPYALWFMSFNETAAVPVVKPDSGGELRDRLVLDQQKIQVGKQGNCLKSSIDKACPVLAEALAVQWLLNNRPCDTKAAILKSGLLEELCPDKPTGPLPADATPADATETA